MFARRVRLAVLVIGPLYVLSCASVSRGAPRETPQSLRQRLGQFDRDATAAKFDQMMTLFAEDVILFGAGQPPIIGKTAVSAMWSSFLQQFYIREADHQIADIHDFGEVVVVRGRALGRWEPKSPGTPVSTDNWFLHVYKREPDGSLRLWRGAFGANASSAATPK